MRYWCVLVGVIMLNPAFAIKPDSTWLTNVEPRLSRWMARYHVPGISVVLLTDKPEDCVDQYYGLARRDAQLEWQNHQVVPLRDLSLPLTALAVLQLTRTHRVNLDLPVNTYLDRWEITQGPYNSGDVTVRGLLSHTAGIRAGQVRAVLPDTLGLAELLNGEGPIPPVRTVHRPGASFHYSHAGYLMLQLLIEDVTGLSFAAYMEQEIYPMIGLLPSATRPFRNTNVPWVYPHDRRGQTVTVTPGSRIGAISQYATPAAYAHFLSSWLAAAKSNQPMAELFQQMGKPQANLQGWNTARADQYGLGVFLETTVDSNRILSYHSSWPAGGQLAFYLLPEKRTGILIAANGRNAGLLVHRLIARWAQAQAMPPPASVRYLRSIHQVAGGIAGMVLAILLLLAGWLWLQRAQRHLAWTGHRIQWIALISWVLLVALLFVLGVPQLAEWLPYYLEPLLAILLAYLVVLLVWILFPRREAGKSTFTMKQ